MEKKGSRRNRVLLDLLILVISLRVFLFIYDKEYLKYFVSNNYRNDIISNGQISQDPAAAANLYYQGKTLETQGKYDDALAVFEKSIQLNPNFGNAHLMLGVVYTRKGQFKEAEKEYKKALQLNMSEINIAITHCNLGVIYLENMGLYNNAIVEYQASIKTHLQPEPDLDPYHGLARAYLAKVDFDKAVEEAKKSVEFHPKSEKSLFVLGTAYLLKKDIESAEKVYGKLKDVKKNSADELSDELYGKIQQAQQERSQMEELSAAGCFDSDTNAACFYMKARSLAIFPPSDFYINLLKKVADVINKGWMEDNEELREILIKNQAAIAEFKKAAKLEKCDYTFGKQIKKSMYTPIFPYPVDLAKLVIAEGRLFEKENKVDLALDNYLSVLKLTSHMMQREDYRLMKEVMRTVLQRALYFPLGQYINRKDINAQSYQDLLDSLVYSRDKRTGLESAFEEEKEKYKRDVSGFEADVKKRYPNNESFYSKFYQEYYKLIDEYYGYLIAASKENKPEVYEEKVKEFKNEIEKETKPLNLTWQALKDRMESPKETDSPVLSAKVFFSPAMPQFNKVITEYYVSLSELNILITAAAIKLYKVKNGRMPDTLQELLPVCLLKLPEDPFNDFEPLKYKKTDKGWAIYSFGPDKEDNEANLQYNENSLDKKGDIVFLLSE